MAIDTAEAPNASLATGAAKNPGAFGSIQTASPEIASGVASPAVLRPITPEEVTGALEHRRANPAFPTWGIEFTPIASGPAHPGVEAPYVTAPLGRRSARVTHPSNPPPWVVSSAPLDA